jgi:hypothetical protein
LFFFASNKNCLVIKSKLHKLIFNGRLLEEDVDDDIVLQGSNIFFNKKGLNVLDIKSFLKERMEQFSILNIEPNNFETVIIIDNSNQKLSLINKLNLEITELNVIDYEWGLLYVTKSFLFINNGISLECYLLEKNIKIWEYYTVQKNEVNNSNIIKIIGLYNDQILIGLNCFTIISLDVTSGLLINQWNDLVGFGDNLLGEFNNRLPGTNSFQLDNEKGVVFSLFANYYIEINLKTNIVKFINLKDSFKEKDIDCFRFSNGYAVDEKYIYTIAQLDYVKLKLNHVPMSIVTFNRETLSIDWLYRLEEDSVLNIIPVLEGDKLYLLTALNKLYIFKKVT